MSSSRPYLIRALYQWICDNALTPYLLVDAAAEGLRVPPQSVKDGRVVLNIAARAVANLELADDVISFQARFNGVPLLVLVPVAGVLAIYAVENGQGMVLPPEPETEAHGDSSVELAAVADTADRADPGTGVDTVAGPDDDGSDLANTEPGPADGPGASPVRRNHLRLIK